MSENDELINLPNVGKTRSELLKLAGINNAGQLRTTGTENVFVKLMTIDKDACLSKLYAIEGAVQGIRWHSIDKTRKAELKQFFNQIKK